MEAMGSSSGDETCDEDDVEDMVGIAFGESALAFTTSGPLSSPPSPTFSTPNSPRPTPTPTRALSQHFDPNYPNSFSQQSAYYPQNHPQQPFTEHQQHQQHRQSFIAPSISAPNIPPPNYMGHNHSYHDSYIPSHLASPLPHPTHSHYGGSCIPPPHSNLPSQPPPNVSQSFHDSYLASQSVSQPVVYSQKRELMMGGGGMERVISPVPSQGGVPSSSSSFYENAGRTPSFHENARRTPSSSSSFHENARRTPSSSSSSFHENARRTPSSSSSSFHKNAKRVPSSPSFHENARRMPSSGPSQMVPSKSFENIGIPPSSSYDHISSQQAPLPFSSSSSHTTPRTPSQYFESHQHDSTPPGFVVVYPGEEDSDPQNSSGFVSLLSPRRETSDDLGPMLGVDMYQEDKGEEGLVVEEEVVLRGKERESESEEEWRAVGIVKEKKSAKRKTRKRKKQKRRRELSDSYVVAPTCPHCLALDGAPLPPLPDDPPLAFVFDCLGKNSKKKEQSAIKQKHESKILALQMSENSSRTKRVLAHEAALSAMDKQHKKEIRQEVRAANERPACLASHHVIEKRLLGKELVGYKKEKVAMKKKVLKEEADKAKKELNAKVAGIKAQKRGDKAAAVKRENVEFKLRKKHLEEFLNHQTDQDVKFYSRSKEFQLEMNQMYARDDLQFDIQKNLAQQKRRKLQEKHRERRRQLQELQDDEEKGLSALFPLQERLLRERADLDLTFLLNHHEFEKDRLELEIQAKAKQERREFRRKWRSEETRITGEIKEMKKAGQKGKAEQEKKRFEKELEKRQFEFYLELEDKAKNRRERLISHQEKKMKEMRKKHRKGAKELRVYQELKRSYMERRFVREQRELLEELANEMRKRKERDASKDSKSREDQFERVKERIEKYQKEREEAREDRLEEVKQMLGAHLGDLEHPSGLSFVTEEDRNRSNTFVHEVFPEWEEEAEKEIERYRADLQKRMAQKKKKK